MVAGTTPRTTKASRLLTHALRRKPVIFVLLAIALIAVYPVGSPLSHPRQHAAEPSTAEPDRTSVPKLIHQTWFPAGSNMSTSAQAWVQTMRAQNAAWEYVLWDDESNELLVERYFPWFLKTYRSLPQDINRADIARNFYMYLHGGMYADVDTEALRPVDALFAVHQVPLKRHLDMLSTSDSVPRVQRAFMGRMAHTLDSEGLSAVPNGWMASPAGHPFWLLPALHGMTGPGILGPLFKQYFSALSGDGDSLRRQLCARIQSMQPGWDLHSLILLPQEQIYPFSWVDDVKERMGVDLWPSYFITHCTHTW
ncbi:nucleotide-diphospho-sugar transferase [Aspergillus desertorum]